MISGAGNEIRKVVGVGGNAGGGVDFGFGVLDVFGRCSVGEKRRGGFVGGP